MRELKTSTPQHFGIITEKRLIGILPSDEALSIFIRSSMVSILEGDEMMSEFIP